LPETAEEVQEIAQHVGGKAAIFLRHDAQEARLKQLNGTAIRYLVLATHGLLGGEFIAWNATSAAPEASSVLIKPSQEMPHLRPLAERGQPALAFTLVGDLQGETGLLTMKEVIEQLRLHVDLAVLSACNTVGEVDARKLGEGEGFVGMARAFLLAGAKRLVVSHWYIDSYASKELMVKMFAYLQAGDRPTVALSKAQADIQRSPYQPHPKYTAMARSHPYFWAPFVVVGD
jgi:CHAT domain-containing protein